MADDLRSPPEEESLIAKAERLIDELGDCGEFDEAPATSGGLFSELLQDLDGQTDADIDGLALGAARVGEHLQNVQIIGLLGRGGMGEVYEGFDQLLLRRVAVKALNTVSARSDMGPTRLLAEARALAQLDHPGICRVYGLIEHKGRYHLVLELIEGATLREVAGDLNRDDKLRIVGEIASAIASAHAAGIVHRDLKPDNVMIQPDGRARVMDFGIARWRGSDATSGAGEPINRPRGSEHADEAGFDTPISGRAPATRPGSILGTFRYMSPEQARGEPVTAASDVFSLAVILQELVTGTPVHPEESPPAEVLMRAAEGELSPPDAVSDAELRRLIKDCTAPDPEIRPTAEQVERRIRRIRSRPRRRKRAARAVVTVALLAAAFLVIRGRLLPGPLVTDQGPIRLAVMPFESRAEQAGLTWVSTGLAEMVSDNLASVGSFAVIPFGEVAKLGSQIENVTPEAVARSLGATVVLTAEVEVVNDVEYRLVYRLEHGQVRSQPRSVRSTSLFDAANEVSARVARRLAPKTLVPDLREKYSSDPNANLVYAIGLHRLSLEQSVAAEPYFRVALDLDPGFVEAKVRLAADLVVLSRWEEARELAVQALEVTDVPGREALRAEVYEVLSKLNLGLDNRDQAHAYAEMAVAAAERSGDSGLLAMALHARGVSLRFSDPDQARAHLRRSLDLYRRAGNRLGEARLLQTLGVLADEAGESEKAEGLFQEALAVAADLDVPRLQAICNDSLAIMAGRRGEHERSLELLNRARDLHARTGDRRAIVFTLNNLGDTYFELGRYDEARDVFIEGEALCKEIRTPNPCALLAFNYSELLLYDNRLEEALERIRTSEAYFGRDDPDNLYVRSLYWLRLGDEDTAREYLERAVAGASPAGGEVYQRTFDQTRAIIAAKRPPEHE